MSIKKFIFIIAVIFFGTVMSRFSLAAISLDRTRVVFLGAEKEISLNIKNENKTSPYLAQAWIENTDGDKIESPFVALPPLQRVEPGAKSKVRVQLSSANGLPDDRETLFYFNLREIPPKINGGGVLQLVMQSKVKMLYRPASLLVHAKPWEDIKLELDSGCNYMAENLSAYYITVLGVEHDGVSSKEFKPVMLPPKSKASLGINVNSIGLSPVLTFIDDYGGYPKRKFICKYNSCI